MVPLTFCVFCLLSATVRTAVIQPDLENSLVENTDTASGDPGSASFENAAIADLSWSEEERLAGGFASTRNGWGTIEVSPSAFLSVPYKDFRVPIYNGIPQSACATTNIICCSDRFYYSPALIIDSNSVATSYNSFLGKHEVSFSVKMWDREFEKYLRTAVDDRLCYLCGNQTCSSQVGAYSFSPLPIEEIRIEASGYVGEYEILNKWVPYSSQPADFEFRLNCIKEEVCKDVVRQIQNSPKQFVSDLKVYYSLNTQKTSRRSIAVKAEHVQSSHMAAKLKQQFSGKSEALLTADEVKELTLDIGTNVMATEVQDEEFISQDQSLQISTMIETLLNIQKTSSEGFNEEQWESVFWNEENARPDKATKTLNENFSKADTELKDVIKEVMSSEESSQWDVDTELSVPFVKAKADVSGSESWKKMSNTEKDKFAKSVVEARSVSEWQGETYTPKNLDLSRVSLSALSSTGTMAVTQLRVSKSVSELSSRINVIQNSNGAGSIAFTGAIMLSASSNPPAGWLECDGSFIDRSLYPELFAVVGERTPDLRGRFSLENSDGYRTTPYYWETTHWEATESSHGDAKYFIKT